MFDRQSKNTIKTVIAVLLLTFLGEGVFSWGLYWPFLLLLLDWKGVYWLAFSVGIFVSIFRGVSVGLPSVFILLVVGGLSLLMSVRKETRWVILVVGMIVNLILDKVFGFGSSIWEMVAIFFVGPVGIRWFEKGETIRINY